VSDGRAPIGDLNARHRATYDAVASRYAVANAALVPAVRAAAVQFAASLGGTGRILDLGCGHGRDIAWFAARGFSVVGADLSMGMLREAAALVDAPLVQLDLQRPAWRRGSFDGIWCNAVLMHLPRAALPRLLTAIRRLLIPGGRLFVSIQVGKGGAWEALSYGLPARRFFMRYTSATFADMLSAAGFTCEALREHDAAPHRHWAHFLARAGCDGPGA
jgi:SAM-dependent methyltransferase